MLQNAAAFATIMALGLSLAVAGCPSKPQAAVVQDAATAAIPPTSSAPTVTELAPLVDDAGADGDAAEAEAPKKRTAHGTGPVLVANQAKIRACCNAMRAQANQLGSTSPEGYQLNAMAQQCDAFAEQVVQGTAPELSQFREILKSLKLPSVCQF